MINSGLCDTVLGIGSALASHSTVSFCLARRPEMTNKIVLENQKTGNSQEEWDLLNGASKTIEGFTSDISYNVGQRVEFKIATDSADYRVDIYRLGYYGGDGARLVGSIEHVGSVDQPDPMFDPTTGLVDAGNWSVTDNWQIPDDIASGVFIAKLTRLDGMPGENHIPFIVRDDGSMSDVLLQTDDTTWQAYNKWGGRSLYDTEGTVAVSYNRPFSNRFGDADSGVAPNSINFVFGNTYPAIRWLEANGYDVTYSTGVDSARHGEELLEHKIFLSVGHDEYWSGDQRTNVEAARDAGVNLAFWSGNDVFWRTRWEESIDGSGTDHRTMITYKTSDAFRKDDPTGDWTGLWRDPDSQYASSGLLQPENALTGTMYMVNIDLEDPFESVEVSSDYSALRFWRHTEVAELEPGESIALSEVIGYEWNVDAENGHRPIGLIHLSSTTAATNGVVTDADYIQYTLPDPLGYATHNLTMYRAASGALVFSAGSIDWVWALDDKHDSTNTPTDANIQQAMINLFADMGVQPETIYDWLVLTTASTDYTAPSVSVSNLTQRTDASGAIVMTVDGTALDYGGGVVAGVEVSADNGGSWHLASGTSTWTYSWTVDAAVSTTFLARAIDDSINIGDRTTPFAIGDSFSELSRFAGFTSTDGWNNIVHSRLLFDANGDGVKDFVGFGDAAVYVHLGAVDDVTGSLYLSGDQAASIAAFSADQGYTATSRRGVDYVGNFVGGPSGSGSHLPVIWGMTANGIDFYKPVISGGALSYEATTSHYDWFGSGLGWSGNEHRLDFAFVSTGNSETGMASDDYASILGFGYAGLTLAPQAFSPSATPSDAYLVQGSAAFGFDAGWDETLDVRTVSDFRGKDIDLNRDGILDVVGIGTAGVVYAFGQQSDLGGTGAGTYSLGAVYVAAIDPSGGAAFSRGWGWDNSDTLRMLADVNGDGEVDIVGFGDAGVYVSLGQAPAADGSGAFGTVYLAIAGYGGADGWSTTAHERKLGDLNGDGLLDIVGFGETATIVSEGYIDPATGTFGWSYASAVYDYDATESWENTMHLRQVTDIDGNGTDEIVISGDIALQILEYQA